MQLRATKVNPSEEVIKVGPIGIRFLLTGDDSDGSMSVSELFVPGGHKLPAPPHRNDAYEETLYGIEGVLTWTVGGTPVEVSPGQALCIPRGAVHRFDNLGTEDAKQLVVISPAILGPAYFREAAEVIGAAAGGPPDREKMVDVLRRHGMTVAAPPNAKYRAFDAVVWAGRPWRGRTGAKWPVPSQQRVGARDWRYRRGHHRLGA